MSESRDKLEKNIAGLLQAALGDAARLDPVLRKRTEDILTAEMRSHRMGISFPDRMLGWLGALLACAAVWGAIRVVDLGVAMAFGLPDLLVAIPLVANLTLLPLAAAFIVQGRRSHVHSA